VGRIEEEEPNPAPRPKAKKTRGLRLRRKTRPKVKESADETIAARRPDDSSEEAAPRRDREADLPPAGGYQQTQGLRAVWIPLVIGFCFLMTLGTAPLVFARRPGFLLIETHRMTIERLSLALDGREIPEPSLPRTPRLAAIGGEQPLPDPSAAFERWLEVPRGHHTLDVEVRLPGREQPVRSRLDLDLIPGETRRLRLVGVAGPDGTTRLRLD
jgi:hypothetical protein